MYSPEDEFKKPSLRPHFCPRKQGASGSVKGYSWMEDYGRLNYTMSYGVYIGYRIESQEYIGYRIESQESHYLSYLKLVRNPAD